MSFHHAMICRTHGIRPLAPARWRSLEGMIGVYWDAEADPGAGGYYLSPDPRIVIFFNDVSSRILMSNQEGVPDAAARPMTRAVYVPAGVPLWTRFTDRHRFSHLDLHLHKDRLLKFLSPSIGASEARAALRRSTEIEDAETIAAVAGLFVDELTSPTRHPVFAESLAGSIAAGLLDIPREDARSAAGRQLTRGQMKRLADRLDGQDDGRLAVPDMAAIVGLSEGQFVQAFKRTTGATPLQWQLGRRIERARTLMRESDLSLADIAVQLGFSDQAHLTKVFRQFTGEPPAAWRRTARPR